ncbi:MAG: cbb3-type cytochrome c oxidase subunit I [Verrucomicrobia bacterium]|nr:cbb3-type cytochrome c oxidase subunit I [Verrucomicrobiota bacterium]
MSASPSLLSSFSPTAESEIESRIKLSEIDASMKVPAILFMISAAVWLMIGTVFAIIAAIKATTPHFLGEIEWLTFGRARTAHLNAMVFGWANNVIFAVAPWIMARLCRTRIRHVNILLTAGVFWNIAITIGIFGILAGHMNGVEWLEIPAYATPLIAISYAMIGVWCIIAFRWRQSHHVYVSQWYILAAFFWLPWLYIVAQIMLVFSPTRGVVQALTNWWFAHNVLGLWLTPIGLGPLITSFQKS